MLSERLEEKQAEKLGHRRRRRSNYSRCRQSRVETGSFRPGPDEQRSTVKPVPRQYLYKHLQQKQ